MKNTLRVHTKNLEFGQVMYIDGWMNRGNLMGVLTEKFDTIPTLHLNGL